PLKSKAKRASQRRLAMRLSTKGRYAVMAMADLAQHEAANKPVSLADIAHRQEISLSYLEQLFAKLRRGGLVRSVRGPGSGKGCTTQGARCVTHDLWEELGRQIHVFLSSVSLADVVEKRVLGRTQPCAAAANNSESAQAA